MSGGYPSWRYHADKEPRVVKDAAEDSDLGPGWFDSPARVVRVPGPVAELEPPAPAKRNRKSKEGKSG